MTRPRKATPPDGFAEFVAARSDALLRSAWLLTGDGGRAEDLLQTVLADVWRRWATITAAGHPEAYVRRALFTTYVSWWRRRWRSEVPGRPPDKSARGDLAAESADRDAVRRALARLSRQQRAVVVLRYVEDLSIQRTAEVLGCSHNTVKVQASRALRILRTDPHLETSAIRRSRNDA
jgi:RNA polymerase sigma-70 factor (sigma-E family)